MPKLDAPTRRLIAAKHLLTDRSLKQFLQGLPQRAVCAERARAALRAEGYAVPSSNNTAPATACLEVA
jgi:hypothetical protein